MARYPERVIPPNGFQIAGQALRQGAQALDENADRQARLRASVQEAIDRRARARLEQLDREEMRRNQEAQTKVQQDREAREAKAAAAPKQWHPTNKQEAIEFEQAKAAAAAANKPPKGPSDGDKTRMFHQANAQKMLSTVWEKIDRMWQKRPDEAAFLEADGSPKTDPMSGLPLRQVAVENWRKEMAKLQSELNETENTAGYPVTRSPFTHARKESRSFLEYAQRAYPGKYQQSGAAPAAHAAPAGPAAPMGAPASAAPRPGDVVDGYRFRGPYGSHNDPKNWEAVQ